MSTKSFSMELDGSVFTVDNNDINYEDWTVIKQESYKLSKSELVLSKFKKDFSAFQIDDYEMLTRVCSRSKKLTEWLINANLIFSDEAQLPIFLKDIVEPKQFSNLQSDLTRINKVISDYSIKKRELADKYKNDLRKLDVEEENAVDKIKEKDKLLTVLSLNSTCLPLTLQLQIEKYVPKDIENMQESREMYGRESLIQYKKMLCKIVMEVKDVDIKKIIDDNQLK